MSGHTTQTVYPVLIRDREFVLGSKDKASCTRNWLATLGLFTLARSPLKIAARRVRESEVLLEFSWGIPADWLTYFSSS